MQSTLAVKAPTWEKWMNLVLSALGGLCWKNIRYERSAGKIAEKIRRFGFTSFVIAFLLIGATNSGAAQSPQSGAVTISQAVQEAIRKNLDLLAERYNVSIADALIVTARMRPNPVLSLYGALLDLAGTGFNELNAAGPPEYGIRADWIIERGGKRQRRIDVAETTRQVAQWRLIDATRTLALDVQNAFVETLLAKENSALAQEDLKSFNQILQVNKVRVEVGDLAPVELRRTQLGTEFLPQLDEGVIWIRANLPPGISLQKSSEIASQMRAIIKQSPEVRTVMSQSGRNDSGSDPFGPNRNELLIGLQPYDTWPSGRTKRDLVEELGQKLRDAIPGATLNFTQPIIDTSTEMATGSSADLAVIINGSDLKKLRDLARRTLAMLQQTRARRMIRSSRRTNRRNCASASNATRWRDTAST
jgi:AcrB/AcrD/AcrF family/Outer membrane efflux protein